MTATTSERTRVAQSAVVVDLDNVYIHEDLNNRMLADSDEEIAELASQIEATNGLLQPIVICPTPASHATEHGCTYELISGYRRCAALRHLAEIRGETNWTTEVIAMVRESDPKQRHIDQLIENLARKDLNPMELANALVKAVDDPESQMSQTELAVRLGVSDPYVSQLIKAARELTADLQEMVLQGKISWSHAKEICNVNLTPEQQLICAAIAAGNPEKGVPPMRVDEFRKMLQETYKVAKAGGDEETTATTEKEASQKIIQSGIPPRVIKDKYLPYFEKKVAETKGGEQKKWSQYMDAAKFFLKVEGTELGALVKPWEDELAKKEEDEKINKEANALRDKYLRACYKVIDDTLDWEPPVDPSHPEAQRTKYNLADAYKRVKESVEKELKLGEEQKLEKGMVPAGFKLGKSVDEFVVEVSEGWQQRQKENAERAQKMKEGRERKLREAKEKEEAEKLQKEKGVGAHGEPALAASAV